MSDPNRQNPESATKALRYGVTFVAVALAIIHLVSDVGHRGACLRGDCRARERDARP
jgi:heme exporter protein D